MTTMFTSVRMSHIFEQARLSIFIDYFCYCYSAIAQKLLCERMQHVYYLFEAKRTV